MLLLKRQDKQDQELKLNYANQNKLIKKSLKSDNPDETLKTL